MKWVILLVLALIWGSSFILMKRGLYHEGIPVLTPWQMAAARLSIAWPQATARWRARWELPGGQRAMGSRAWWWIAWTYSTPGARS